MSDLKDILKEEIEVNKLKKIELLYIGIIVGLCLFFVLRGVSLRSDESITTYKCPDKYEKDSTVLLEKITEVSRENMEDEIRSFARKYIQALYPKNGKEAEEFYKYIIRHTKSEGVRREYIAYQGDIEKISKKLDNGAVTEFFPKNSQSYQIRKKDNELAWVYEIEGYMNNRITAMQDDRGVVTLRLTISLGEASRSGSYSGLYVDKYEILHMEDVVTKDVKNVKSN